MEPREAHLTSAPHIELFILLADLTWPDLPDLCTKQERRNSTPRWTPQTSWFLTTCWTLLLMEMSFWKTWLKALEAACWKWPWRRTWQVAQLPTISLCSIPTDKLFCFIQMEVWETNDYELLDSPLAGELKLDEASHATNYLDWINWDQKLGAIKSEECGVPESSSSDSGLSSDFHCEQQLSPCKSPAPLSLLHCQHDVTFLFIHFVFQSTRLTAATLPVDRHAAALTWIAWAAAATLCARLHLAPTSTWWTT